MKNNYRVLYSILLIALIIVSCSSSDDSGGGGVTPSPEKATLKFPNNNEECTDGIVVSSSEAKLTFEWNAAENATSYSLYIKNLDTDVEKSYDTNATKLEVTIGRAVPYSWYLVSKADGTTETATSDSWKFYMSGDGVESYAPFPAELKSPKHNTNLSGSTVTLEWAGSDVDNDIKAYDVYMDTNNSPTTKLTTITEQTLANQAVIANTTYYWKIVTHDEKGNSSTSTIFSFDVQ